MEETVRPALRVAMLLAGILPFLGSAAPGRTLTFEDRVRAQEAIERVYYSHQIGTTKPFEDAMPRAAVEAKVSTYLRQSLALKEYWNTPITAESLRHELERI